jgi:hypothetical protein
MNKTVVIAGSVLVLGVGAYLYFRPKKTGTSGTGTTGTGTTGSDTTGTGTTDTGTTSVPPTGTTLSTPAQVEDLAKKIAEAKSLATKISDKRTKRSSYLVISLRDYATSSGNEFWANNDQMLKVLKTNEIAKLEKEIQELDEQIGKLGYMEVNGSIAKIV